MDSDHHIKLFLSIFTQLDDINICFNTAKQNKVNNNKNVMKKRKVNTTSNLTSLLNIPDFMRQYGPLRLYWEGEYKGGGNFKKCETGCNTGHPLVVCHSSSTKVLKGKKHGFVARFRKSGHD